MLLQINYRIRYVYGKHNFHVLSVVVSPGSRCNISPQLRLEAWPSARCSRKSRSGRRRKGRGLFLAQLLAKLVSDAALCWDAHFLDSTPLPLATEDVLQEQGYCVDELHKLHEVAALWKDVDSGTEGLWTVLLENDVSHKALVALLAYLIPMDHGVRTLRGPKREAAFVASTVYLSLIGLPGSRAFKIYSPDLMLRAVDILKMDANLGRPGHPKKSTQSGTASQRSQSNTQSRKRRRVGTRSSLPSSQNSMEEEAMNESEEEDDDDELSPCQVARLQTLYIDLLTELVSQLEKFSLRESMMTCDHVIKVLVGLTRRDNHQFDGKFPLSGPVKRFGVAALAYKGVFLLCQPLHGDITALTTTACKYLMPHVLMLMDGNKVCTAATLPQFLQLGREHAIAFVRYLLTECGEASLVSVKILLQHLCMRAPDRAEYRNKTAQAFVKILQDFPDEQYASMLKWIGVLSRNEKSSTRTFSMEVIILLLALPERTLTGVAEDVAALASHAVLVQHVLARCSDVAAAVRTRAITGFAQCLESGGVSVRKTILEMITPRPATPHHPPRLVPTPDTQRLAQPAERTVNEIEQESERENNQPDAAGDATDTRSADTTPATPADQTPGSDKPQTPFCSVKITEDLNNSLAGRQGVVSMLHQLARDEKVFVRKAALQALHKYILFEAPAFRQEDIDVLCERCRDYALAVRKQALVSLTEILLQFQNDPKIQRGWLKGVLPMLWDQEMSVQEKCLEILDQVILSNIVPCHRSKSDDHTMAWQLLTVISKEENRDLRRHMKKACRLLEQQKKLKTSTVTSLLSHIGTENTQAAWSLLADLAATNLSIDTKPVIQYWENNGHSMGAATKGDIWENVLKILGSNAKNISNQQQAKLIDDFKSHLLRFELQPPIISALASAIHQFSQAQHEENFLKRQEWGREILAACDQYLSTIVLDEDSSSQHEVEESRVTCYLFTLGVVALLCPSITPKRTPMLVQSFVATPCITAHGDSAHEISAGSQPSQPSQGSELSTEGSQGTQSSQSQSTQPLSQFRGCKMPDRVRAFAFLTLGKLCLQEKSLAKKCVPAMARELEMSPSDAVRNNIVIILRDLCIRYTTLVDPYVTNMASCLRDPAPIVRRQTLELLTGLLQEDYLKWKGVLFFRFIVTLLDPHPEIRSFAEFCLGFHLLKRHPALMSQHLLESIFVFNDYSKHTVFNKYEQTEREKEMFSLKGIDNRGNRLKLYRFMLEHMEDEHRFNLTAKISQEVLGAFVDGILPFDEDSHNLLQDTLAILSSKEIKLASLRSKPMEEPTDEMELANAAMATVKKTLITQVVKRHVMENVIPVVLSLKRMMEKERSPLVKDLMAFLRELFKDYRNEVKEILAADKQLACEVEYDLRQFDRQEGEGTGQGQTTPVTTEADQAPVPAGGTSSSRPTTPSVRPQTPAGSSKKTTPAAANQSHVGAIVMPERSPKPRSHEVVGAIRQAALQTIEKLRNRRQSDQSRRRQSSVTWAENVLVNVSLSEKDLQQKEATEDEQPNTPQRRRPLRAISTPTGALSNVTFAGENMTLPLAPPSPIPGQNRSQTDDDDEEETEGENIIFMNSPDVVQPKPRKWKVKVKNQEEAEAASLPAAVNSPVISRSRRGRR